MKLSFEARFCKWPAGSWTYPLRYVPLASGTRFDAFCSRWIPCSESADVKTFLHSCVILLLLNNISSFVCLLAREVPPPQPARYRNLHHILILWQTHCLLAQGYIWHQVWNFYHASELVHLIPLCLALLLLDTCYSIAFHGGLRTLANSFIRTIFVIHHAVVWLMPLLGLTCAVHKEYADCIFIS